MSRLSLPREHGGYLTLGAAAVAGVCTAPSRWAAIGLAVAVAAAFFARAPVERWRRPASWDRVVLGGYALALAAGVALAARVRPMAALVAAVLALALVGASLWARSSRLQRDARFELVGMTALGASAGAVAFAGGASPHAATLVAVILGAHAASSVLLVRSELRPVERAHSERARAAALAWIALGAALAASLGPLRVALALMPRLAHLGWHRLVGPAASPRASRVGVRETILLALAVAILIVAQRA
jgi:hypothetical protein